MLITADTESPERDAIAAPRAPKPNTWIRIGSRTAVTMFDSSAIFTDVEISIIPRKVEKPTNERSIGRKENARILK
jgi:hypothetical protein